MEYAYPIESKRVAAKVERINGRSLQYRIVPNSLCYIKPGTRVLERPNAKIIDEDGNEVKPDGKFLWSAETIDPFHLVIDMF